MVRRLVRGLFIGVLLLAGGAAVVLVHAHLAIRRERATLPLPQALAAMSVPEDAPIRVRYVNTARQPMPRSAVLDASRDPSPGLPYVMGHPSIVLEWDDGRLLLVDTGMTRDGAESFGRPLEWVGAAPIEPLGSVATRLGAARSRVRGVLFTHLHTDHTGGLAELCEAGAGPIQVFMSAAQAERPNYTTRPGLRMVGAAPCVHITRLEGGPVLVVPGFPGISLLAAGGHTPGSQVIVASVRDVAGTRRYAFAGDLANAFDGVRLDLPKPRLYSLLLVPEDTPRLAELRAFLRTLDDLGIRVVVAHDLEALERSGIPPFSA